jgi:hypothetical protein
MTSANVTEYTIRKDGEVVGQHRQHCMCHTRWHRLFKFTPYSEYTITPHGLDEEEAYWEGDTQNLRDFMQKIKFHPSDIKRMTEHLEKQNDILKKWVEKFSSQDRELTLKTLNSISYSPL